MVCFWAIVRTTQISVVNVMVTIHLLDTYIKNVASETHIRLNNLGLCSISGLGVLYGTVFEEVNIHSLPLQEIL